MLVSLWSTWATWSHVSAGRSQDFLWVATQKNGMHCNTNAHKLRPSTKHDSIYCRIAKHVLASICGRARDGATGCVLLCNPFLG